MVCFSKNVLASISFITDTFTVVKQKCKHCGNVFKWSSQPYLGNMAAGNILMSAAILFSGGLARKSLNIFKFMGVASISENTFYRHQSSLLYTIENVWKEEECRIIKKISASKLPLRIGGDGRNDSVGHSAKYGSYTIMDLDCNEIIGIQIVQVI